MFLLLIFIFFKIFYYKVTYSSIASFFQYGTSVNVKRTKDDETEFPQVTICNLNSFDVGTSNLTGEYINKVYRVDRL